MLVSAWPRSIRRQFKIEIHRTDLYFIFDDNFSHGAFFAAPAVGSSVFFSPRLSPRLIFQSEIALNKIAFTLSRRATRRRTRERRTQLIVCVCGLQLMGTFSARYLPRGMEKKKHVNAICGRNRLAARQRNAEKNRCPSGARTQQAPPRRLREPSFKSGAPEHARARERALDFPRTLRTYVRT